MGARLSSLRIEHCKETKVIARDIKIPPLVLVKIEKGEYDLGLLFDLCKYYGISPHVLLEGL